jgi:hypothetical protein
MSWPHTPHPARGRPGVRRPATSPCGLQSGRARAVSRRKVAFARLGRSLPSTVVALSTTRYPLHHLGPSCGRLLPSSALHRAHRTRRIPYGWPGFLRRSARLVSALRLLPARPLYPNPYRPSGLPPGCSVVTPPGPHRPWRYARSLSNLRAPNRGVEADPGRLPAPFLAASRGCRRFAARPHVFVLGFFRESPWAA